MGRVQIFSYLDGFRIEYIRPHSSEIAKTRAFYLMDYHSQYELGGG